MLRVKQRNGVNRFCNVRRNIDFHLYHRQTVGYCLTFLSLLRYGAQGLNGILTNSFSDLLRLGTVNYTAYGKLPAGQYVTPGVYSDTLIVTVTY